MTVEFWYSKVIIPESYYLLYLALKHFLSQHPVKPNQYSSTNNE